VSLGGVILLCIFSIVLGKVRRGRMSWVDYLLLTTVAILQAAVVLYDMFTLQRPPI
jgi:hypothetical protein